jgi:hypothetical protein
MLTPASEARMMMAHHHRDQNAQAVLLVVG